MPAPLSVPQSPARLGGDMWGLTAYFNPAQYVGKHRNLIQFCGAARRQNLRLLIVELAIGEAPFAVEGQLADRVLRLRSNTVLWHKERLLNLGLRELPEECDKVVWLDADVLFENSDWVAQTGALLDSYVVVQPFQHACWMLSGETWAAADAFIPGVGPGRTLPGMGFAMARKADKRKALGNYYQHGHSGFAWAARRELLQRHGLYDNLILGGGDLAIAQAFYSSDYAAPDAYPPALDDSIHRWRRSFYAEVQGSVFYTGGRVLHLWHGENENRRYSDRAAILREGQFDPASDIRPDAQGCWEWSSDKPELHRRVQDYFRSRREDGE